jgi:tRNA pseudouridine32 synthase/23S rRNA pseudouridine746 synthase/23S rRNA pseudouridine955/2504/2580 synthase
LQQQGGWVAIDKPPGLLVIPGRDPADCQCAKTYLEKQLGARVWVCHRIDRDTSGVVLFATDADAHRTASMAFEHGEVKKTYLALVEGRVEAPLEIDEPSKTLVRPIESFDRASLVECEPLTGRQHQLRVHLESKGHPLLFDHQYGRAEPWALGDVALARTPLHAATLKLGDFEAQSPLPKDMTRALEMLRQSK